MTDRDRFFSTSRPSANTPWLHHGYVYDRNTNEVIVACDHRHFTQGAAENCGRAMLGHVRRAGVSSNGRDTE